MCRASQSAPVVSYYDRQYGQDESTDFSDITVASNGVSVRVTDTSMPPPSAFSGSFLGDYSGIAVGTAHNADSTATLTALSFWSDTRDIGITSCPDDPRR